MSVKAFDKGDLVKFTANFSTDADVAADPTGVVFKFKRPDKTVTVWTYGVDAQITRDTVGAYHAEVAIDQPGDWTYRWEGTGALQAAEEMTFIARATAF